MEYETRVGVRHLLRQRNRLSTHIGLEAGYNYEKSNYGYGDNFDRSVYLTVPILWRYQVTEKFSFEAEIGLGVNKAIDKEHDYGRLQLNTGIGFKYRLGKGKSE